MNNTSCLWRMSYFDKLIFQTLSYLIWRLTTRIISQCHDVIAVCNTTNIDAVVQLLPDSEHLRCDCSCGFFNPRFKFQQDGAPSHYHCEVRGYHHRVFPEGWVGRTKALNSALMKWPPRSPRFNPLWFFPVGLHKGECLCVSTENERWRVWQESDYRIDISRITYGVHIEGLLCNALQKNLMLEACEPSKSA